MSGSHEQQAPAFVHQINKHKENMTTRSKIIDSIYSYVIHTKKTEASYKLIEEVVKHRNARDIAFVLMEVLKEITRPEHYVHENTLYADSAYFAEEFCRHLTDVIKGELYDGDDFDFGEFDDPVTEG
jgi:protein involved in sex pheromone biosynthesis